MSASASTKITIANKGFAHSLQVFRVAVTDGSVDPASDARSRKWQQAKAAGRADVQYVSGRKSDAQSVAARIARRLGLTE